MPLKVSLKNNTKSTSRKGTLCKVDPLDPNSFILLSAGDTSCLGVVAENKPYRAITEIITSGEVQVWVNDNAVKGSLIRALKSSDRASQGQARVAKTSDAPYLLIGTALESGKGLIRVSLSVQYMAATISPSAYLGDEFETVSKNLRTYPYTLTYGVDGIDTIVYDLGGGLSITKTFNYTLSVLTSIVLSGDTPSGIELTKTLSYTGADLTGVVYS